MSNFTKLMQQAAAGVGGDFYDYEIDYSVRIQGTSSKYLTRTTALASSPTDAKKLSFSCWLKLNKIQPAGINNFFEALSQDYPVFEIYEYSGYSPYGEGSWEFMDYRPSPEPRYLMRGYTISQQRDFSAWYHLYVVVDTTLSTGSDRYKLYLNGVPIPFTTYSQPAETPQNTDWHLFTTTTSSWGMRRVVATLSPAPTYGNDFYLAETHVVDGTAYDISKFGKFKNGVWVPVKPSGISYGNGGFYLDFADSSDLGKDVSGNGNHYTSVGLTSSDQMIDTPTNNFMTVPILVPRYVQNTNYRALTGEGNTQTIHFNSSGGMSQAFPQSGKWYFETLCENSYPGGGYRTYAGVATNTPSSTTGSLGEDSDDNFTYYFYEAGSTARYYITSLGGWQTTGSAGSGSLGNGDIVGFAVDMDNGTVTSYVNNVQDKVITWSASAFSRKDVRVVCGGAGSPTYQNTIQDYNFGQNGTFNGQKTAQGNSDENGIGDFYYTPPSGYLACCTQNFPEPTIGPNSDIITSEVFDTVLYTGNGTAIGSGGKTISDLEFQPDFTWIKNRDATDNHMLFDAVRGATKYLSSNSTNAEATDTESLTSFTSTGFTLGNNVAVNTNTEDYVAWNWKANGSGVPNTDGTITSSVSANTDAGISIVTYTGNGVSGSTVGHGLGVTPDVIIHKPTYSGESWFYFSATQLGGWNKNLRLEGNYTPFTGTTVINNASTSTFTIGTSTAASGNGNNYVDYVFAEVEGFSKFGKYTGNGISDGPFIYTNFRPAWVMFKRTDSTSGGDWLILDSTKEPYNVVGDYRLYANSNVAESPYDTVDYLSNGFKMRQSGAAGLNASGGTYIYMAFAENPFKYSNAR